MTAANPETPETYPIFLYGNNFAPQHLDSLPTALRPDLRWLGEAAAADYIALTGDNQLAYLKDRLAVEAEGRDGYGIVISLADLLVHEHNGSRSMQAALLRSMLETKGQPIPAAEAGWRRLAKTQEQMAFPALKFLLRLARNGWLEPDLIDPEYFVLELQDYPQSLTLADFAHLEVVGAAE